MVELGKQIAQLRLVGLEEFSSYRYIEEQVAHLDVRAHRTTAGLLPHHVRTVYLQQRAGLILRTTGDHLYLRYRANRSQRLTTETHRTQREQILRFADLTGGMTFKSKTGIHLAHSDSVIDHLQQRTTGITNNDLNALGAGIQTVLHQLFQTRCRALNNLACRNLIRYAVR